MSGDAPVVLLADVGGTNLRVAVAPAAEAGAAARRPARLRLADHPDPAEAFARALDGRRPGALAVAAAGPVLGDGDDRRIQMTNARWRLSTADLAARFDCPVALVNDLEAVALALPALEAADLAALRPEMRPEMRPGTPDPGAPRLAVNVGTGFGASLAVSAPGGWTAVAAEPGHMRFSAVSEAEWALAPMVATMEDALSGRGLGEVHRRLSGRDAALPAAEVVGAVETDPLAGATVDLALELLARVASDLVLATGAWGGLHLTGGVLDSLADRVPGRLECALEAAFARPNPVAERLSAVPAWRIVHPMPALLGLSRLAARL